MADIVLELGGWRIEHDGARWRSTGPVEFPFVAMLDREFSPRGVPAAPYASERRAVAAKLSREYGFAALYVRPADPSPPGAED